MKTVHFVNGMPRSGSTLLCNVLAQNPDFHSTPTSGLSEIISNLNLFWKQTDIIKASEKPEKLLQIVKDLLQSFHYDTNRPIIFNKSRAWVLLIELIENAIQKEMKIIVTTRKIPCILASLEKLYRKELKTPDSVMQPTIETFTLEGRLNLWTSREGIVGLAFNNIRDAIIRGHAKKIHFLDFDEFTISPKIKMKELYEFLEKPYFEHDFNNVQQYTTENDREYGFTSLHHIRSQICPVRDDSREILGNNVDIYKHFNYKF